MTLARRLAALAACALAWPVAAAHHGLTRSSVAEAQSPARPAVPRMTAGATGASAAADPATDTLLVTVLTMGPGDELYERFGHQSLRIRNLRTGVDSAYNWGMFDFDQPHFYQNFLTGNTLYWMQGYPTVPLLTAYRSHGRAVWEQELDLTAQEKDSVLRFIQWNATEAHKWYRYDYYRDNCATRVRDLLDGVLNGAFHAAIAGQSHGVSFRSETMRLSAAYPTTNIAMDFALGARADSALSAWDEMFVPMRLQEWLRVAQVRRADGTVRPLVRNERVVLDSARFADGPQPPSYTLPALVIGFGLALVIVLFGARTYRSVAARWSVGVIGALFHLVAGSMGIIVAVLGTFTKHVYMAQNVNVLLGTPASLALALLLPLSLAVGAPRRVVVASRALSAFTAGAAIIALVAALTPFYAQRDGALLLIMVPPHLALTWGLLRATRFPRDVA